MNSRDHATELARHEVAARTFGVTQQYLAVHNIVKDESGEFEIARIDEAIETGSLC